MKRALQWGLRLLVAAVLIYAAYMKLKDSYLIFAMSIDAYQLLPPWAVMFVARTLPTFELLLGVAILAGWKLRYTAAAAAGLLGAFFVILVYSYLKGMTIDCGCFGTGDMLSPKTLLRDGVLLASAVALTWMAWKQPLGAPVQSLQPVQPPA